MARKRVARRIAKTHKRHILATASRLGLTAVDVEKRFGVSRWTYYSWRKRSAQGAASRAAASPSRRPEAPTGEGVRAHVEALLPGIVRDELARAFASLLRNGRKSRAPRGGRGRGRARPGTRNARAARRRRG